MKNKLIISGTLMAMIAMASVAQAASITGSVELTADASVVTINTGANSVTFTPDYTAAGNNAKVDSSSGSLALLLPSGTGIEYKNFTYSPLSVVGGNPIWFSSTTSFDITGITIEFEGGNGLLLSGTGILKTTVAGYEPTLGTWSFNASRTGATFSWGSTASANVPDGGTSVALLGVSLLGLAGARRKFAR
ncbi:MAG: VPDSG-CTERM sorting domain-containing protein [Verrucomicrobiota bacterium]